MLYTPHRRAANLVLIYLTLGMPFDNLKAMPQELDNLRNLTHQTPLEIGNQDQKVSRSDMNSNLHLCHSSTTKPESLTHLQSQDSASTHNPYHQMGYQKSMLCAQPQRERNSVLPLTQHSLINDITQKTSSQKRSSDTLEDQLGSARTQSKWVPTRQQNPKLATHESKLARINSQECLGEPIRTPFIIDLIYKKEFYSVSDNLKMCQVYLRAAYTDNALAQFNLGLMYQEGCGFIKNESLAAYWYYQAAKKEIPEAQYNLGFLYHQGRGTQPNKNSAIYWYRKAAQHGLVIAQNQCIKSSEHTGAF